MKTLKEIKILKMKDKKDFTITTLIIVFDLIAVYILNKIL
jgi:hypothetical protein